MSGSSPMRTPSVIRASSSRSDRGCIASEAWHRIPRCESTLRSRRRCAAHTRRVPRPRASSAWPSSVLGIGSPRLRAISVRPPVVERISARDLNITAQTLALSDAERFDLIVGTNVFVYDDRLQRGLAMVSAANMLRPGGLLLSNNALVEVPSAGMRSIGYTKTLYSNREEDGDVVIWYQKGVK